MKPASIALALLFCTTSLLAVVALRAAEPKKETPAWPENPPANWLTFHLAHPGPGKALPADPNCAFDYKGRYHLHYIYRNQTGYVFAHVSSDDMVHWKWHPTVLGPSTTGHGMFSGTGFYTKEGKPAIIYHGEGSGRNWIQYPLDDQFNSWSDPEPVLPKDAADQVPDIRHFDPDCWLNGETYYALSGGQNPQLMKSTDLKNWTYLGDVLHEDYPADLGVPKGEDISCANMFKIGDKWMLLCISHPLGCRYYLGDFKDEKYLPELKGIKVGQVDPEREMTVRDLLRHTSGLPNNVTVDRTFRGAGLPPLSQCSLKEMVERLDNVPLIYAPGKGWHYSFATEVLARLIEVASGQPFDAFLAARIFEPLDMKDTGFHVPTEKRDRFAVVYGNGLKVADAPQPGTTGKFTFEKPPKFLSAGGGLVSTATDYMRFCLMLSGKGILDGKRLLKAEAVEERPVRDNAIPDRRIQ